MELKNGLIDDGGELCEGEVGGRLRAEAGELDTRNLVDGLKGLTNEEVYGELEKGRRELMGEVARRGRSDAGAGDDGAGGASGVGGGGVGEVGNGEWLEVAIENVEHDFNAGTVVRNANNFNVARVHIVGRRKYNRRGAMCTDKYLNINYWGSVQEFLAEQRGRGREVVAIENNVAGCKPLAVKKFTQGTTLVFGSEGGGLSAEMLAGVDEVRYIEGWGSTRSVNVGVASGIAMYEWARQVILGGGEGADGRRSGVTGAENE